MAKGDFSLLDLIQNNGGMTDPIGAIFRGLTAPKPQGAAPTALPENRMAASGKTAMPQWWMDWLNSQGQYGGVAPMSGAPQGMPQPMPAPGGAMTRPAAYGKPRMPGLLD